jgi:hypothetical protein
MIKALLFISQTVVLFVLLASTGLATMPPGPDDDLIDEPVCKMLASDRGALASQKQSDNVVCCRSSMQMRHPLFCSQSHESASRDSSPLVVPLRT